MAVCIQFLPILFKLYLMSSVFITLGFASTNGNMGKTLIPTTKFAATKVVTATNFALRSRGHGRITAFHNHTKLQSTLYRSGFVTRETSTLQTMHSFLRDSRKSHRIMSSSLYTRGSSGIYQSSFEEGHKVSSIRSPFDNHFRSNSNFRHVFPCYSTSTSTVKNLSAKEMNDVKQQPGNTSYDHEWNVDKVRSTFVDYFVEKQEHAFVPSSPVVPYQDPTLLFSNAGMNQFKPIFLGQVDPSSPFAALTRATNSQKCIRAGGKHNDLEDVGMDTYHHTFFEMLGTWSFGNYFKKECIDMAWDLLVNEYKLDKDRLYVTYFGGDEETNLPADLEAKEFWLKYLPEERVLPFGTKDNFWEMGDTGPCGPSSEIHFDRIGNRDASKLVNQDDPDCVEIWNLVFIQFNRDEDKSLRLLPNKHIDTGLGLERLTSILQEKPSNYDTDIFMPLFDTIYDIVSKDNKELTPYTYRLGKEDIGLKDTAYRVLADHARTLSFALADGAIPSNEGRGYVLRRILRRAVRYGIQIMGAEAGFFAKLIPKVCSHFGTFYPELQKNQDKIVAIIEDEEKAFSDMLKRGVAYFEEYLSENESKLEKDPKTGKKILPGSLAFYLYDTLGFPLDLTELMAAEKGEVMVDIPGFEKEMSAQKERSREAALKAKAGGKEGKPLMLQVDETAHLKDIGVEATNDDAKYIWDKPLNAEIKAIFTYDGFVETKESTSNNDEMIGLVFDKTSFYGEAGGQVGDKGIVKLINADGKEYHMDIVDVQCFGSYILHIGSLQNGSLTVGDNVTLNVDYNERRKTAPNHTMTHVLNFALREVLKGSDVSQKGSLVTSEKLRFDFSHNAALTDKELAACDKIVNDIITSNLPISNQLVDLELARSINGLNAVFGETYPDPVRVVSVGKEIQNVLTDPADEDNTNYSVEFCGGTHIMNTKEAKAFSIIEEGAVAKGIRRITAVTGDIAVEAEKNGENFEAQVKEAQKIVTIESDAIAVELRKKLDNSMIPARLKASFRKQVDSLQKQANTLKKNQEQKLVDQAVAKIGTSIVEAVKNNEKYLVMKAEGITSKAVKGIINTCQKQAPELPFLLLSEESKGSGGKVMIVSFVPEAKRESMAANEWLTATLNPLGGKGGGRKDTAQGQAGSSSDDQIDASIKAAEEYVNQLLK